MKGNEHGFPGEILLFTTDRLSIPSYFEDVGHIKCFFQRVSRRLGLFRILWAAYLHIMFKWTIRRQIVSSFSFHMMIIILLYILWSISFQFIIKNFILKWTIPFCLFLGIILFVLSPEIWNIMNGKRPDLSLTRRQCCKGRTSPEHSDGWRNWKPNFFCRRWHSFSSLSHCS